MKIDVLPKMKNTKKSDQVWNLKNRHRLKHFMHLHLFTWYIAYLLYSIAAFKQIFSVLDLQYNQKMYCIVDEREELWMTICKKFSALLGWISWP